MKQMLGFRIVRSAGRNKEHSPCRCGHSHPVWRALALVLIWLPAGLQVHADEQKVQTSFRVKYVSADAIYLDGGSGAGLTKGQRLTVKRKTSDADAGKGDIDVAEIQIESVASLSAVGKIISSDAEVLPGDVAYLSAVDIDKLKSLLSSREARKYPQVVTFTEGDPLDEEVRESLPRPPLPSVNRVRGRIGFEYGNLQQPGGGIGTSQVGLVLRMDATRLGGSYWNLSGFYRGLFHSTSGATQQATLTDLVNRTYHLGFYYDNPESRWAAGAGRLYIPWATSLGTIDGFYLGRHRGKATVGMFAGSAPDPTSWSYNPRLEMAGGLVNFEGGSFDSLHFTSTSGIALTGVGWHRDRQFAFIENGISYKRYLSIYSNQEIDLLDEFQSSDATQNSGGNKGLALSRSYLTVRVQPTKILSLDISENYFRNVPTFDLRLLGTGLLDKYLFQGLSGGFRLDLPYRTTIYSGIGRSSRTGDAKPSWDYMMGFAAANIFSSGLRADLRYSKFDSSFGSGTYRSLMLSRSVGEALRFDVQVGQQDLISTFTNQGRSRFLTADLDWILGRHYFADAGLTFYRGAVQNYNQWFMTLGYRFDNRGQRK